MRLDADFIQSHLLCGEALVFDEINSTNAYLLNHTQLPCGSVCLAEQQTAGRGRRGRQWYSPAGQNLYFSLLWRYPTADLARFAPLSLAVAVVIAEVFEQLHIPHIQIKWPNDIYYCGKKMGGILIETKVTPRDTHFVIGIGLNLAMEQVDSAVVTQAWSDLSTYQLDRNQLATRLLPQLQQALMCFAQGDFAGYLSRWQRFDRFYQQPVKLLTEQQQFHGIAQGINSQGELLLQQGEQLRTFAIGEISLRAD